MTELNKDVLLFEIKAFGYRTIDDLIKIDKGDKHLIPIILKHLSQLTNENDKEYLVRCLGVKGFCEATDTLIKEFKCSSNNTYKWAIGNSLSLIMDKNYFSDYIEIVMDKKHGTARQMVIEVLGKFKDKRAVSSLLKLLEDEDMLGHALIALSNFKDPKLIPYVEPFLNHPVSWIRHATKRVKEKLEKLKIK